MVFLNLLQLFFLKQWRKAWQCVNEYWVNPGCYHRNKKLTSVPGLFAPSKVSYNFIIIFKNLNLIKHWGQYRK